MTSLSGQAPAITPSVPGDRAYRKTPEFRRTLRAARKLATASRWNTLLRTLVESGEIANVPELLIERVRAAIELGDREEMARCAVVAASRASDDIDKLAIASSLVNANAPDDAWKVLATVSTDRKGTAAVKAIKIAQRIVASTSDPSVKASARGLLVVDKRASTREEAGQIWPFPGPHSAVPSKNPPFRTIRLKGVNPALDNRARVLMKDFTHKLPRTALPHVVEFQNVFTNRNGQVWREDGTVVRGFGRPIEPISRSRVATVDALFSCSKEGKGYYEWLTDRLPGLAWRLGAGAPDCQVFVNPEQVSLAKESLVPLGLREKQILPSNEPVFCKQLFLPVAGQRTLIYRQKFTPIFDRLEEIAKKKVRKNFPQHFFISRRDTDRRKMANEDFLERAAEEKGIVPVVLSKMGLLEKIQLFRNAKLVVGAHGAGLSHLLFGRPGLRVIEIVPVAMNHFGHMVTRVCFAQLSAIRDLDHTMLLHPMNPATGAWEGDIARILELADAAIAADP